MGDRGISSSRADRNEITAVTPMFSESINGGVGNFVNCAIMLQIQNDNRKKELHVCGILAVINKFLSCYRIFTVA